MTALQKAVFCLVLPIFPAGVFAQTLPKAACIVAEREPELRAAGHDSEAAFHQWQTTRAERRPNVFLDSASGLSARQRSVDGLESNEGDPLAQRNIGVSIKQLIFDGGVARNASRQAHAEWNVQQYLERGMIEERIVDLAEVYLEIFRAREQIEAARRNIGAHRNIIGKLRAREEMGLKPEIALVEGRIGAAERELELQELALKQANNRFKRLVGCKPENLVFPKIPSLTSKDKTDLSCNWDYLAAAESVKVSQRRLQSINGNNVPKVYLDAGYSKGYDNNGIRGTDDETRALLTFNWDLYKGGENNELKRRELSRIAKAQDLMKAADEQRKYRNSMLWDERNSAIKAGNALRMYKDKISSASSDYEEQFVELGSRTLLSILDLQSEQYRAEAQLIDARFERDTSAYRILGNQGRLTKYFGIKCDALIQDHSMDDLTPLGKLSVAASEAAMDVEASADVSPTATATPVAQKKTFKIKFKGNSPRTGGIFKKAE